MRPDRTTRPCQATGAPVGRGQDPRRFRRGRYTLPGGEHGSNHIAARNIIRLLLPSPCILHLQVELMLLFSPANSSSTQPALGTPAEIQTRPDGQNTPGAKHEALQGTREIYNTPLKFPPGQGWSYGSNVDWAGQVIEKIGSKTLGECLSEAIFQPLGMNDTTFRRNELAHVQNRLVPPAHRDTETGELAIDPHFGAADPV